MIQWPNLGLFGDFDKCQNNILDQIAKNFEVLDAIVQLGITDFVADESALPASPGDGDRYITQDDNNIWYYANGQWNEILSLEGFIAYNRNTNSLISYDGTTWINIGGNAINLGSGSQVFAQLNATTGNLEFRTLIAGTGISLTQTATGITIDAEATASNIETLTADGDGNQVDFTLPSVPASEDSMLVWVDGNYQEQESWSFSGTTFTFSEAPGVGTNNIVIKIIGNVTVNTLADGSVTSVKLGTNSVTLDKLNDDTKTKYRIKTLSSNITTETEISDLAYNGLTIGQTYVLKLNAYFNSDRDGTIGMRIYNDSGDDSNQIGEPRLTVQVAGADEVEIQEANYTYVTAPFVATSNQIRVESVFIQTGDEIVGDGTINRTFTVLYEHNNLLQDLTL